MRPSAGEVTCAVASDVFERVEITLVLQVQGVCRFVIDHLISYKSEAAWTPVSVSAYCKLGPFESV